MKHIAVLLLAGASTRFASPTPKTIYKVKGKELFLYPLETLNNSPLIDQIVLVTNNQIKETVARLANFNKLIGIVDGGETREHSVLNAIKYLNNFCDESDLILICDGDRPNISNEIIERNIEALKSFDGCVTAVKAVDSTFKVGEKGLINYLDRSSLYNAQTPQSFKFSVLKNSFDGTNIADFTDDASIAVKKGYNVGVVEGSYKNFKITTTEDIKKFEDSLK